MLNFHYRKTQVPEDILLLTGLSLIPGGKADSRMNGSGKSRRNFIFRQPLSQSAPYDNAFVPIEPGKVIELLRFLISWINILQLLWRIKALRNAQLCSCFFDQRRAYDIPRFFNIPDDVIEKLSFPMLPAGFFDIHFKTDVVRIEDIGRMVP